MGIHRIPRKLWYYSIHKYSVNVGLLAFTNSLEFEFMRIHTVSAKFGLWAFRKVTQIWICGHQKII